MSSLAHIQVDVGLKHAHLRRHCIKQTRSHTQITPCLTKLQHMIEIKPDATFLSLSATLAPRTGEKKGFKVDTNGV